MCRALSVPALGLLLVFLAACGDGPTDRSPSGASGQPSGGGPPASTPGEPTSPSSGPPDGVPSSPPADLPPAALDASACPPGTNVILGTPGDDVLVGTPFADCILGGEGDDRLEGGNGDDFLAGGPGSDVLMGGNGVDHLHGEDGDDVLDGGNGEDVLDGGPGNDVLSGGNGPDALSGGSGNDVLVGANAPDTLDGGDGDDVIDSGRGPDASSGGAGNDACSGPDCEGPEGTVTTCSADAGCAGGQRCAAAGVCVWCLADSECDDGNACTSESCQPALGCRNPNVLDGTLCLDATVCNGSESCTAGVCLPGIALACDPGYVCEPVPGCVDVDECAAGTAGCDVNATCSNRPGSFTCSCNLPDWEGDGFSCLRWCEPVTVGGGIERCVRARGDGTVSLHLTRDDRTQWREEWLQSDEPEDNFCGPTAAKNLLFWHGLDVDYGVIADELNTNTWDTGLVIAAALVACGFEPICTALVSAIVSDAIVKAGTIPGDMRSGLHARTPPGYVVCEENGDANLDEIRFSLANGNPVVYLESRGEGNLHWAVVTGIYLEGGALRLRIANSDNRSWDDFVTDWSVSRVGGDVVRGLLDGLLGIEPYVVIRWEKEENAVDLGGGLYACP